MKKIAISKLKQFATIVTLATCSVAAVGSIVPARALTFNFFSTSDSWLQSAFNGNINLPRYYVDLANGMKTAGNLWANQLTNNVTINVNVAFIDNPNVLAQASSRFSYLSYTQVYNALKTSQTSADDAISFSNLSAGSSFNRIVNYTREDNTANTTIGVTDTIALNTANAKALGTLGANDSGTDVTISWDINNLRNLNWNFSHTPNIGRGQIDFVSVALHELGHGLGFSSGVSFYDLRPGLYSKNEAFTTNTLDLFRYSSRSNSNGNNKVIDMAVDDVDKYFSIDGGLTKIAAFSRGVNSSADADYQWQASHWAAQPGLGTMEGIFEYGQHAPISENDLRALDAIGWTRKSDRAVPEPSTWIGTFIFGIAGIKTILKRRQKLAARIDREPIDSK